MGYFESWLDDDEPLLLYEPALKCPVCGRIKGGQREICRACGQLGNQNARKTNRKYYKFCVECGGPVSHGSRGRCASCAQLGNQYAKK